MYDTRPNLVIGFHGCDLSRRESLLNNSGPIEKSEKPYDWLGHGVYFWENNFARAAEWAADKARRGEIKEPAVIGAVLNLGICCDLLDSSYINLVSKYYQVMRRNYEALGKAIPKNRDAKGDPNQDKLIRELDCAVIELMHEQIFADYEKQIKENGGFTNIKLFDSTRGVFTEGGEAFEGSAIQTKNHIQICVRNLNCIQGFFLPRADTDFVATLREEYERKETAAGKT